MMTSSNGNIFRVTGLLCVKFTSHGEFPSQRPVTRSFDVFFDLRLNKRLSKQSRRRWFEIPSRSLWHHCNDDTTKTAMPWQSRKIISYQTIAFRHIVLHVLLSCCGYNFVTVWCCEDGSAMEMFENKQTNKKTHNITTFRYIVLRLSYYVHHVKTLFHIVKECRYVLVKWGLDVEAVHL